MNYFWLDASAIIKHYISETGTPEMNYFFAHVPLFQMYCLLNGIGEVISIFVRHKNDDKYRNVTKTLFNQLKQQFENEFIYRNEVELVLATEDQITDSWELIEKHSINSTDAIILQCALDLANDLRSDGHRLVLVSSDKRLIRAAKGERMLTFDPENDTQTALDTLINVP
ncbi:MAG: type II toxin-antitoxin system VapC family toxin [Candidatus Poribacteria bacterium]|nr:type II toxin-antitoxin system VapC family toxin [Candidatus Poribacteria bacterium]